MIDHPGNTLGRLPSASKVVASGLAVALAIALGAAGGLLAAIPVLLLLVAMAHGRYPGERTIARARVRFRAPARRSRAAGARPRQTAFSTFVAGALLIARALAKRGPPAPAVLSI